MSEGRKFPEFRKQLTRGWWLANSHYTAYMIRELTSLFITVFSLLYIYQLSVLASRNTASYASYLNLLKNPFMIGFSIIILAFSLYHSFTWFYLTGKVQPIKLGKRTTTPTQALVANTIILGAISYGVIWLFLLEGLGF